MKNPHWNPNKEARLLQRFLEFGAHLLPPDAANWKALYYMQHYGLPTRLLDWTANFAAAVYFAVRGGGADPCVWILNPYELNELAGRGRTVVTIDQSSSYRDFIDQHPKPFGAMAISGDRTIARLRHQAGSFTLHGLEGVALECFAPKALLRLDIPPAALAEAKDFLTLAGMNEFSIYQDLDGLARYLRVDELGGLKCGQGGAWVPMSF